MDPADRTYLSAAQLYRLGRAMPEGPRRSRTITWAAETAIEAANQLRTKPIRCALSAANDSDLLDIDGETTSTPVEIPLDLDNRPAAVINALAQALPDDILATLLRAHLSNEATLEPS